MELQTEENKQETMRLRRDAKTNWMQFNTTRQFWIQRPKIAAS